MVDGAWVELLVTVGSGEVDEPLGGTTVFELSASARGGLLGGGKEELSMLSASVGK